MFDNNFSALYKLGVRLSYCVWWIRRNCGQMDWCDKERIAALVKTLRYNKTNAIRNCLLHWELMCRIQSKWWIWIAYFDKKMKCVFMRRRRNECLTIVFIWSISVTICSTLMLFMFIKRAKLKRLGQFFLWCCCNLYALRNETVSLKCVWCFIWKCRTH